MVDSPKAVVKAWVEAFNRADADAVASFYTENAVNHQVAESPVRGCGFFHVREGKIAFQRGYWDRLSLLRSQGAPFEFALRAERPEDAQAIRQVHRLAFGREQEARLVDALRAAGAASISEVAIVDGRVAGHILFSPVEGGGLGLAPLAVLPELYARFGFVPARRFGLHCKWPGTQEAFLAALELVPGALEGRSGLVSYHAAFDDLA